jgi:uncharacterized membrane protein
MIRKFYPSIECWHTMTVMGTVFFAVNAALVPVRNIVPLLYIGIVTAAWAALFFSLGTKRAADWIGMASKRAGAGIKKFFTPVNSAILSAHMFDATATFFAISMFTTIGGQGYTEQHFLSRSLMPFLGPGVMFLLKLAVVIPALWFIDRYMGAETKGGGGKAKGGAKPRARAGMMESPEMMRFLKLAVFILGAAPAARNLVRLLAGV